jgi:radical SAM protein with 4Fe4S-binding SPASM domain
MGVDEFQFVQYAKGFYRHDDGLYLTPPQKRELVDMDKRLKDKYPDISITIELNEYAGGPRNLTPEKWARRAKCSGGRSKMLLKPNGDVTLCEQTPARAPFIVGNVFKDGVMGAWNSPDIHAFNHPPRELFSNSVCSDCLEFDMCHDVKGYCYRDSLACYGSIYDAPPLCPRQTKIPPRFI